jgi:hypothetical protein
MTAAFPREKLARTLKAWWKRKAESPLCRKKSDPRKTGGTVFDIQPEVSSLEAVEVVLEVEPLLDCKLSSDIIKQGGYQSCDEFVDHLLIGLESKFSENDPIPNTVGSKPQEGTRAHAN